MKTTTRILGLFASILMVVGDLFVLFLSFLAVFGSLWAASSRYTRDNDFVQYLPVTVLSISVLATAIVAFVMSLKGVIRKNVNAKDSTVKSFVLIGVLFLGFSLLIGANCTYSHSTIGITDLIVPFTGYVLVIVMTVLTIIDSVKNKSLADKA